MNFDLEKPFSLSTAPASFKFLEEELLCTSETNFIIIFNLLKFFSVTRQSYVLRISALDLLSNRIPQVHQQWDDSEYQGNISQSDDRFIYR